MFFQLTPTVVLSHVWIIPSIERGSHGERGSRMGKFTHINDIDKATVLAMEKSEVNIRALSMGTERFLKRGRRSESPDRRPWDLCIEEGIDQHPEFQRS